MEKPNLRVGIGYDIHPLVPGRKLILGGVSISNDKGLSGWSDADVVIHAIIDALCGAADLGDKGTLFPPGDVRFEGISSLILLVKTYELLKTKGFQIVNIDSTIIAEKPRLSPYIPEMRNSISQALKVDSTLITIKASSSNGLESAGRGEGIASHSVALIWKSTSH